MIDRVPLRNDLQRLLPKLEADLRARASDTPAIDADFRAQHAAALTDKRTAAPFLEWREDLLTQVGVAWILACVFVRFLEDNAFLDHPLLAGPGARLAAARDQHTLYIRANKTDSDREYLLHVFATVGRLPALGRLYDAHNPLRLLGPSADGAQELLRFWQRTDPATGALIHDFTDPDVDTRFVGDLYQDLSEAARKRFALLQTPIFVEEFILDRTLEPAIQTFGLRVVRMIDPTCGSGHFLLGGFQRLFAHWQRNEPGTNVDELVRRALVAVHGIDLNPFAVAISRFRLLVAALRVAGIAKVRSAPAWPINVFTGDALLFGPEPGQQVAGELLSAAVKGAYRTEDAEDATRVLSQRYHAVVGNPPYITVDDKALNEAYRQRFASAFKQYSLAVPFLEKFFDLGIAGDGQDRVLAGFIGCITANSFMKKAFGRKLVESFIPSWDLTHIIDTTHAFIPGHTTPTVIIFGRNQQPVAASVRIAMSIKGEPKEPMDPARGEVWCAITNQIDHPGTTSDYITVTDFPRVSLRRHPWALGGGGAAELKDRLDSSCETELEQFLTDIGAKLLTRLDDLFEIPVSLATRHNFGAFSKPYATGEDIRDWLIEPTRSIIYPYNEKCDPMNSPALLRFLWPQRRLLTERVAFGMSQSERGLPWYSHSMIFQRRINSQSTALFSDIATHNHFSADVGSIISNSHAPALVFTNPETRDKLVTLLNSSTTCFWLKQVNLPKAGSGLNRGIQNESWEFRFEFDSGKLWQYPVPLYDSITLFRAFQETVSKIYQTSPSHLILTGTVPSVAEVRAAKTTWERLMRELIFLQEELDWEVYALYGLTAEPLTLSVAQLVPLSLGERAFEITLARKIVSGEGQSEWFARHNSSPVTKIPADWPSAYQDLVERRLRLIATDKAIGLIERPEYKRRWNITPWAEQLTAALRTWLLDRLEALSHSAAEAALFSVSELAERTRADADFQRVAGLYTSRPDFDLTALVADLVAAESVPSLPGQRYKESGLRKRTQWEETWTKQRAEDAITARLTATGLTGDAFKQAIHTAVKTELGDIPVPPKYASADFLRSSYWKLRGKLDVPKERWISYPGAERTVDPTPVLAWAGWTHLEQAQALAAHYERLRSDGASESQLGKLLASLAELIPWLLQWHNEIDPSFGERMGTFFQTFVEEESRRLHLTAGDLSRIATTRG